MVEAGEVGTEEWPTSEEAWQTGIEPGWGKSEEMVKAGQKTTEHVDKDKV